jgi:7-cyano-7-deazaguanine synthase
MVNAILLSGGMDSIALLYWQRPDYAITIDYGQKPAQAEIQASSQVANALSINHIVLSVDCSSLGSGDLMNSNAIGIAPSPEWWPFRNQLLITVACMRAVSLGITELMVGAVSTDAFHKDGSKEFFDNINRTIQLQEGNIKITAPALSLSTEELIKVSEIPDDLLFWAHSCHKSNLPCGQCRGCNKYLGVLQKLGYE